MGFFKKLFSGVKKVFKKVGKAIRTGFKSIGKFVGKLGVVGQIGLGLLLPGVGSLLGNTAGFLAAQGGVVGAAGNFINAAINVGTRIGKTFTTITKGVSNVIGEVVGTAANKLGLDAPVKFITDKLNMGVDGKGIDISNKNFGNLFDRVGNAATDAWNKGRDLFTTKGLTDPNEFMSDSMREKVLEERAKDSMFNVPELTDEQRFARYDKYLEQEGIVNTDVREEQLQKMFDGLNAEKEPSLLRKIADDPIGQLKKGAEAALEKGLTKTGEAIASAPATAINTAAQKAGGGIPDVTYTTYATSVARLPETSSVGSGDIDTFNPLAYINNNTNFMNTMPIGYNANVFNQYKAGLQQRIG